MGDMDRSIASQIPVLQSQGKVPNVKDSSHLLDLILKRKRLGRSTKRIEPVICLKICRLFHKFPMITCVSRAMSQRLYWIGSRSSQRQIVLIQLNRLLITTILIRSGHCHTQRHKLFSDRHLTDIKEIICPVKSLLVKNKDYCHFMILIDSNPSQINSTLDHFRCIR